MDGNELLMSGGIKPASFPDKAYGTKIRGIILREPEARQQKDFDTDKPKFYDSGEPMMVVVVPVLTNQRDPSDPDDRGERAFWIKGQMMAAVRDAVKASGATGLKPGGDLSIEYIRDEPNSRGRGHDKKVYVAEYIPPSGNGNQAIMGAGAPPAGQQAQPAQPAYVQPGPTQVYTPPVAPPAASAYQPDVANAVLASLAPGGQSSPPNAIPPAPNGVDPERWASLPPDQRQSVLAALGLAPSY